MMDISDGLLLDLSRLCAESAVGARLELPAIPIAAELRELSQIVDADPLELALSGGEDYELLAAIAPPAVAGARAKIEERFGVALTDIGEITEQGFVGVDPDGTERPL